MISRRLKLPLLVSLCAACSLALLQAGGGWAAGRVQVVKATITGHPLDSPLTVGVIHFSPSTIRRGTVLMKVTNKDLGAGNDHYFEINGRTSADINPGATATLKVTFTRPGNYGATCPDEQGLAGTLKVT
jgi:hypothetical protein